MLKTHLEAVEKQILVTSRIPANSGHSLHKGTPRESFIENFLTSHLSRRVDIGKGEIIDADSKPGEHRNQLDIVLYKPEYPRIDFGGSITGFLVESVVAVIEVKSVLTKEELEKAIKAAVAVKQLKRNVVQSISYGYQPPAISYYVIAYDGPQNMSTVHGWLEPIHKTLGIELPNLDDPATRYGTASPTIDGIFVLGKGVVIFENHPLTLISEERRKQMPNGHWSIVEIETGSLLILFLHLTMAVSGLAVQWLDPHPYLKTFVVPDTSLKLAI
jgi:hypothetical protein